ncbi:TOPRIM domain containing protein [uncultured Caudovirales phage]|uniref:TOPRIM domain containing protein n=1 Tax=uncultured Caudovirales phage TaxID=2100421 RepID=A0A6J5SQ81_9CAUD|nr:TOPRIM domain containing protein [uncultured Caudovirales phage]
MSEKISIKLLRTNAPKNMGEQVHINHEGCPAGTDTKKRLYIKRVPGGILGYCHHCNSPGFIAQISPEGRDLSKWLKGADVDIPDVSASKFWDMPRTVGYFSAGIPSTDWIEKYFKEVNLKYIAPLWDDNSQVLLTIYPFDNDTPIGYQIRNTVKKPKYLTKYFSGAPTRGDAAWFIDYKRCCRVKLLVITEDYLSAYKIYNALYGRDMAVVALLKTTASDTTIREIQSILPLNVVIWLDNDGAGIAGCTKLSARLKYVLPDVISVGSVKTANDPKDESPETIRRVLSPWLT